METTPFQAWCQANGITAISKVRTNTNGYPFVTVLNASNEAENIYFSKKASALVEVGDSPTLLAEYVVANTTNADGESRLKLTTNTEYMSVAQVFAGAKAVADSAMLA